jgi:hypothetical protein
VTDALRYVGDKVNFDVTRSFCTEDDLVQGCCGVVVGVRGGEIFTKRVRWAAFFYDPASLEPDFSDAKYLGTDAWWDLDDALADPDYGATDEQRRILEEACEHGDEGEYADPIGLWGDAERKRLQIIEIYWKEGDVWWSCHTTRAGDLLAPEPIPYVDDADEPKNWCPLIATSCFVIQEDDDYSEYAGERYGIVRDLISPQDEINHRRSRTLHDGNVYGAVYEESAVENIREFLTEMSKPGGMARVRDGALVDKRIELRKPGELSQVHLGLLQEAKAEIDNVGPSLPNIAGDQRAQSGRAIIARQAIGSMELERPFDNLRQWQRKIYRAWWWLIRDPQFGWHEEMWLRVRDSKLKEGYRFVPVNRQMTRAERVLELVQKGQPFEQAIKSVGLQAGELEVAVAQAQQVAQQQSMAAQAQIMTSLGGQQPPPEMAQQIQIQMQQFMQQAMQQAVLQHPVMQQPLVVHQIGQLCMDILIGETPDTAIAAQEEFEELLGIGRQVPQLVMNPAFMRALVMNSNLRHKQELIDALEQKPDPMQQQMAQMQIAQLQMGLQQMQAQIANLQAQAQLTAAKGQTEQAKAQREVAQAQIAIPAEAQRDQADAMNKVADAGQKTVPEPGQIGGQGDLR